MIVEQEIHKVSLKIGRFVTLLSARGGWGGLRNFEPDIKRSNIFKQLKTPN